MMRQFFTNIGKKKRSGIFYFILIFFAINYYCYFAVKVQVFQIGLLQQTIKWYKIRHAGGQAHYHSRTGTLKQRPVTLDWLRSLCPSAGRMADFVPCDRFLQKPYFKKNWNNYGALYHYSYPRSCIFFFGGGGDGGSGEIGNKRAIRRGRLL